MTAEARILAEEKAGGHILLVDDDRLVLATLKQGLSKMGYTLTTCDNGQDALALYSSNPPDLVVLDVRMPGMSGLETARAMLESAYRPILMLSAHDDQAIVKEAVTMGVAGYLVKPIEASQMAPSIEAALARFAEVNALLKNRESLCEGLEKNRVISTAVGIVMERGGLGTDMAFEHLRRLARAQRRPLRDVAQELVSAVAAVNSLIQK